MTKPTDSLDGTLLEYTYEELGTVQVIFKSGRIAFEWIAGPLKGEKGENFEYRSKRLADQQFFVNWHEPDARGFVTVVYDLNKGTVCSSVLAAYGTENEQRLFETATIHRVEHR